MHNAVLENRNHGIGSISASIIIPVAKEGPSLYDRIQGLASGLAKTCSESFEIVLVTDVLHTETLRAMARLAREGVAKSLLLTARIGKGGSIKNAVSYARGSYIVLLDADIPVTPGTICNALRLARIKQLDLVIANRVHRTHSTLRKALSTAYNTLVNLFFRTGLRDHQAGFKILSRKAAQVILTSRTRTDGLAYDTEIIVWAKKHNYKYQAINVAWNEQRKGSTIPPLRALLTMLADLVVLRLVTLGEKHVALRKVIIGRTISLENLTTIGNEYMTTIKTTGPKTSILQALRILYAAVAFRKPQR